eukprot:3298455-Pleurochrysis_carterae.AAC.4
MATCKTLRRCQREVNPASWGAFAVRRAPQRWVGSGRCAVARAARTRAKISWERGAARVPRRARINGRARRTRSCDIPHISHTQVTQQCFIV